MDEWTNGRPFVAHYLFFFDISRNRRSLKCVYNRVVPLHDFRDDEEEEKRTKINQIKKN